MTQEDKDAPQSAATRLRLPFAVTVVLGVALDLYSKHWAFASYTFEEQSFLLGQWLSFQLAYNRGAVWGILQGQVDVLAIFSLAAIGFMLFILYKERRPSVLFQLVLGLIVAGALGNLYDRLVHEKVRDFIVVWLGSYRWPTFNVADAYICVGVVLFLLREMTVGERAEDDKAGAKAKA